MLYACVFCLLRYICLPARSCLYISLSIYLPLPFLFFISLVLLLSSVNGCSFLRLPWWSNYSDFGCVLFAPFGNRVDSGTIDSVLAFLRLGASCLTAFPLRGKHRRQSHSMCTSFGTINSRCICVTTWPSCRLISGSFRICNARRLAGQLIVAHGQHTWLLWFCNFWWGYHSHVLKFN